MIVRQAHAGEAYCVAFSPDGRLIATGGADRVARVWGPAGGPVHELYGHADTVWRAAFSPDSATLATAGFDGRLGVWDAATGKGHSFTGTGLLQVRGLAYHARRDAFAYAADSAVCFWDHPLNRTERRYYPQTAEGWWDVKPLEVTPLTLAASARPTFPAFGRYLHLAAAGERLLVATEQWCLLALDWTDGQGVWATKAPRTIRALAVNAAAGTAATAADESVQLWRLDPAGLLAQLPPHPDWVWSLAFTPDGRSLLSSCRDGLTRLWDLATLGEVAAWRWEVGSVWSVAVAPDGLTAACCGADGRLVVWDLG